MITRHVPQSLERRGKKKVKHKEMETKNSRGLIFGTNPFLTTFMIIKIYLGNLKSLDSGGTPSGGGGVVRWGNIRKLTNLYAARICLLAIPKITGLAALLPMLIQ